MVLHFDLSIIPVDAKIKEATLSVYPYKNFYDGKNGPKSVYRLTKNWNESNVSWNSPWSKKGGDFATQALASSSNSSLKTWEDYDVGSAVKDMVENSGNNYGFLIKFDSMTPGKGVVFYSSESALSDKRPKLTVTYDAATNVVPVKDVLPVLSEYNVTVFNVKGREIASYKMRSLDQLDNVKKSLSSGAYIFSIKRSGKMYIKTFRFEK